MEKQDWDLDIKNPNKKEEENYKSPQELLDKIKESLKESQDIVGSINDLL